MAVFDDIKTLIAEEVSVSEDRIKESSNLTVDFGADSLTIVEMVMEIEEKYDIEIPEGDLETLVTVGDVVVFIENALAESE
ncbi:MAG TPA: acyl carrier protein [Armatimonadota bacterium]|nr:acyl carrier protein [Armatimonadota bacterium]